MKKPQLIILIVCVTIAALLLGLVVRIGPSEILGRLFFSLSEDTEYARGYSESAFERIETGDTEASVRKALGSPLNENKADPHLLWLYTSGSFPEFELSGDYPDMGQSYTVVIFDEDERFIGASGQISHGPSKGGLISGTIGDGANTLKLTDAEIEKFRLDKATPEQIEAKFGKPKGTFESRVIKWMQYSHSPGSTHYLQRLVGIDHQGKVCRKVDDRYWD